MKVVIQRVLEASVEVDNEVIGRTGNGYLLLVGITDGDDKNLVSKVASKIVDLRIFEDSDGKMNLGLKEVGGSILSISQFTLYADTKKGRRPSFSLAAKPEIASPLFDYFNECLKELDVKVETGKFGAEMKVSLINDGPVTIIIDTKEW